MEPIVKFNYNAYRRKAGIYRIMNSINHKSYIGQSIDLGKRIYAHIRCMRHNDGMQAIYRAVRKYGIENFYIEIITVLPEHENLKKNLDLCEKVYISFYNTYENGYNSTLGGDGGILGYKMPYSERMKRSISQKGIPKDPLQISKRAKTVYMYDIKTGIYIVASSTTDASNMASAYGYSISSGSIQDCARNYRNVAGPFVCSYSLEGLKDKIYKYDAN